MPVNYSIEDFLKGRVTSYYIEKLQSSNALTPYMLEDIFPYNKTENLEFETIFSSEHYPVSATFTGFDGGGKLMGRDGLSKFVEELRPIKITRALGGKLLTLWAQTKADQLLINPLFDDIKAVYDGVRIRTERMRAEVMQTGKLEINENGVKFAVDYEVPESHKVIHDGSVNKYWSNVESNPLDDMNKWLNYLSFTPEYAIISPALKRYILTNSNVKQAIYGTDKKEQILSWNEFQNYLTIKGLPPMFVYNYKYRDVDSNSEVTIWQDKKFVWATGNLGYTHMGPTIEEILAENVVRVENGTCIVVYKDSTLKSSGIYTTASATALTTLNAKNNLFIADLLA